MITIQSGYTKAINAPIAGITVRITEESHVKNSANAASYVNGTGGPGTCEGNIK